VESKPREGAIVQCEREQGRAEQLARVAAAHAAIESPSSKSSQHGESPHTAYKWNLYCRTWINLRTGSPDYLILGREGAKCRGDCTAECASYDHFASISIEA
jgi:hypothetical protein